MRPEELLGKRVRVWDMFHSAVFVEGDCIAVSDAPTIVVRTECECGREKHVSHVAHLPIDVQTWQPMGEAT